MTGSSEEKPSGPAGPEKIRLDKWLWQARFFKSRALAAKAVNEGVRVNSTRTTKAARTIAPGDVLTFTAGRRVRIVKLLACGTRRGPAPEAQALYEDMSPPVPEKQAASAPRFDGGGRPTKRDRRTLSELRARGLE
ncbi:RNA-binding S4 domain-containing protein [Primorskyibacter sp. S187A]|uniref:RNA-binding S4 domain-containing protein n=1 Tax=Primorskyibacter sp. S187A TaxID=3415130 RepID=UPI003C7A9269